MERSLSIGLRGVVAAGLGRSSLELSVPADGIAISLLLRLAVGAEPRLERYLALRDTGQLRTIVNGKAIAAADDPTVYGSDAIVLLAAVAGG
jgi:hypothetical protein